MAHDFRWLYAGYAELAGAEVSFEVSELLIGLCSSGRPDQLIVDLGSGWSSFLFRAAAPQAIVWSVDTDPSWLGKTVSFCTAHGVPDDGRFVMLDRFEAELPRLVGAVDVVLHDMGRTPVRIKRLPMALDLVKVGGVAVLDDMHKGELCQATIDTLRHRPEFVVRDQHGAVLDLTMTQAQNLFDRFAWTATRTV